MYRLYLTGTHTRALSLVACVAFHSCALRMDQAQGMMSLCESSQNHSFIGHVVVGCSFDSILSCVFFTFHLTDNTSDLSIDINWNQIKPFATPLRDGLSGRLACPIPNSENARGKLEVPVDAAMPCKKKKTKKHSQLQKTEAESCESNKISKTKHACIVEAHESTNQRNVWNHLHRKIMTITSRRKGSILSLITIWCIN